VVSVEQWAEIRRMYFAKRLSIKEIVRCTGHGRNTIRRALRSDEVPRYRRPPRPSKLDPFREEIHRLLGEDARLPGKRVRELLEDQGYEGGKTILDDYLREVRPLFAPRPRTFQRTSYRPGALWTYTLNLTDPRDRLGRELKDPGKVGGSDAGRCPGGGRCSCDGQTEEVPR